MKDESEEGDSFFYNEHLVPPVQLVGLEYQGNKGVHGRRLRPGEVIEEDDVYNSTNGRWEKAPCPGLTLGEGDVTIWIRPSGIENAVSY